MSEQSRVRANDNNTGIIYTTNSGQEIEILIANFDVKMTDATDPDYHDYNAASDIPNSEYVTDRSIIDRNFREEPAPTFGLWNTTEPVETGDESYAFPVGTVTHYVVTGPGGETIIVNVTNEGHLLYPGVVVRELYYDENGKAHIDDIGSGTGMLGDMNEFLAEDLWQDNANRIGRESLYEYTNEHAPQRSADSYLPGSKPNVPNADPSDLQSLNPEGGDGDAGNTDVDFIEDIITLFGISQTRGSPLVLDLDGDGIELTSLSRTGAVYWDIDQDGYAEASGWVTGGDGLLALDKNGDGIINNNGELFGNSANVANGFDALAVYDTNADGAITAADAAFSLLKVWVDTNGNGYSESGELHTLTDLGITSITTSYTDTAINNNGNVIEETSTFVQNGTTRSIVDAWFAYDSVNTVYNGDYTLDVRTLFMPTLRGYGNLPDLHIAMSLDNTGTGNLLDKVAALSSQTFAQIFDSTDTLKTEVRDILFRWAGVDDVVARSRGSNVDAQELEFLEELMGQEFLQQGLSPDPYGAEAGNDLREAFSIAFNSFYARLVAQTEGGKLFTGNWSYDPVSDSFTGVTGLDTARLDELKAEALGLATTAERETFWENVVRMVEYSVGTSNLPAGALSALEAAIMGSDVTLDLQDDILPALIYTRPAGVGESGGVGDDTVTGSSGDDVLSGAAGNDTLNGLLGDDDLNGDDGHDVLNGGLGSDYLKGRSGNDTYSYNAGEGSDTILETFNGTGNDDDKILFGSGIALTDLSFQRLGASALLIDIGGSNPGQIVIEGQFAGGGAVEKLQFSDGSVYILTDKVYTTQGTSGNDRIDGISVNGSTTDTIYMGDGNDTSYAGVGNDIIYGGNGVDSISAQDGDDTLYGDAGDDKLDGGNGNDTLTGGMGNDSLIGGAGNDIYYYDAGTDKIRDGNDVAGLDEIRLASGMTPAVVSYARINGGSDLLISVAGYGSMTLENQFQYASESWTVETLRFYDNSAVNLKTLAYTTQGTSGNDRIDGIIGAGLNTDTIYLYEGNDTSYAGAGADTIYGGTGDDSLHGQDDADALYGGLGNDTMTGDNGNDTIYGDEGDDIIDGGAGDDVIYDGGGNDRLTGDTGNDIFIYSSGNDTITDGTGSGVDEIRLAAGITPSDLSFTRTGGGQDLLIGIAGSQSILIERQFYTSAYSIETLRFADNSTIDLLTQTYVTQGTSGAERIDGIAVGGFDTDTIYLYEGNDTSYAGTGSDIVYGGSGNDSLNGQDGNDALYGEDGDDVLDGGNGNNTLDSGAGNDTIYGGTGNDVYIYTSGSDVIRDYGNVSSIDEIRFADGIVFSDITLTRTNGGSYLQIDVAGRGDILVQYQFTNSANFIETLRFADNSVITLNTLSYTSQGTSGNDRIDGVTFGGTTTDTIYLLDGNDTSYAGAGNDLIYGGNGNDNIYGDDGDDTLYGGAGDDRIEGRNGIDTVSYADASAAVTVSLALTTAQNTIGAGIDTLATLENLTGSNFGDTLTGSSSANTIDGGSGDDTIQGGLANDVLMGGAGSDTLSYSAATAAVTVSLALSAAQNTVAAGTDTVSGFENLLGSNYNDMLSGDAGDNTLEGAAGDDVLDGGLGLDTASYAGSLYGVTVNLGITGAQNTYGAGTDTLVGIENLIGSNTDDYLYGNALDNLLVGNDENDELGGGLGTDRLEGGAGSDTYVYNAGDGIDTILDAGEDYDLLLVGGMSINEVAALTTDGEGALTITFEEGVSAIRILNQNSAGYGVEGIAFEDGYLVDLKNYNTWVLGSAGDNFFYGSSADSTVIGKAGNDVVYGDMGLDNIHGGLGNDTLNGGGDADYLFGEEGNDILMGDTGDDLLDGGDGADQLFGDEGRDILYGEAGADILYGWDGNDILSGGADDDTLYGETGDDALFGDDGADQLFGGFAHDMLYGGIGNDVLHGEYDNDTLYGEAENDTLYGDSGNDTLYGGEGNDVLLGGYGWDTLYGGNGLDAFVFKETDAIDHVKDFNTSQGDYLELQSLLVGYDPVASAIADFVTSRQVGGDTIISVDRDGAAGGQYTSLDVIALDAVTGINIQTMLDNEQLRIAA